MSLETDFHCRKGCGFYGNPEWNWHCSKCWREHLRKTGSVATIPPASSGRSHDRSTAAPSMSKSPSGSILRTASVASATLPSPKKSFLSSQSSFSKFEDKKKRQTLDKNFKQIFQGRSFGGGSGKESPEKHSHLKASSRGGESERRPKTDYSPEARLVSQEFVAFLKQRLSTTGISDISKQVKNFTDKLMREASNLSSNQEDPIHDLSAQVQEFYQTFRRRLETKDFYHTLTEDDITKILDYSEKFIMICCYKSLFCPPLTNDEEKDLELQTKIRNLNWLSTQELKCPLNESSQEVRDLLNQAIHDILEVDGKMAPQDKLDCIVRCSKRVFEILKVSNENPASADDFLPCLIYVCLRANPPRVQSNINFITRFCNENKLRMGEGGYFFVNLCCAIAFIENMTAETINMDQMEFDSYVSGRAQPPGSWRSAMLTCEGLHFMSQNVKTLADLKNRLSHVQEEATSLQLNMDQFQRDIEAEVKSVLDRTPFEIKGPKVPVAVDADLNSDMDTLKSLPPPLVPHNVLPVFDFTAASPAAMRRNEEDVTNPLRLEDFWSVSDMAETSSLLSLNISNFSDADQIPEVDEKETDCMSLPVYRGFSAQSSTIPSIACDSDVSLLAFAERVSSPPMSASSVKSSVTSSSQATDTVSDTDGVSVFVADKSADDANIGNKKDHVSSTSGSSNEFTSSSSSSTSSSPQISNNPITSNVQDLSPM